MSNSLTRSPLFYVGDKFKLMSQLKKIIPNDITTYYEPFVGGGSASLNINANRYCLSDVNSHVVRLHNFLLNNELDEILAQMREICTKYDLSMSGFGKIERGALLKTFPKTYIAEQNRGGYLRLRSDFNSVYRDNDVYLYTLLIYGFNRILRFNKRGEFNVPIGNLDLNQNVIDALTQFKKVTNTRNIAVECRDYLISLRELSNLGDPKTLVYLDPPYLIAGAEYNKIWSERHEVEFLQALTEIDRAGVRFMLSNVLRYKDQTNQYLSKWAVNFNIYNLSVNYINRYDNQRKNIEEVLITNFEQKEI